MRYIFAILLFANLLPNLFCQTYGNANLTWMAVDVCGNEASSQYFLLTVPVGKYFFSADPPQVKSYCPDSSSTKVVTAYTANTGAVATLNTKTGTCGNTVFYDIMSAPHNGSALEGAKIMVFVSANPDVASIPTGALASLCGQGPILVAFGDYTGTSPFFYNNQPYNNTCGSYSVAEVLIGGVKQSVTYNPSKLAASDGAYIALDQDNVVRYGLAANCSCPEFACSSLPGTISFSGDLSLCEQEKTTITASVGSGHQYAWSTGTSGAGVEVGPAVTTSYIVTVTSTTAPQCQSSAKVTVNVFRFPRTLLYTEGENVANACYEGKLYLRKNITPTSNAPSSYQWIAPHPGIVIASDESITINEQTAGTYQCVLQYSNGCVDHQSVEASYSVQTPLRICTNSPVCIGQSATLQVSHPGSMYNWTGPGGYSASGPSQVISDPVEGMYQLSMKDENGCTMTGTAVVILKTCGPLPLNTALSVTPASCGNSNGSITVTTAYGTAPYTYSWSHLSGPNQPATVNNLPPATYTVTVTDADDNTNIIVGVIPNSTYPSVALSATGTTCANLNGAITTTITNGIAPYTINWADLSLPTEPQNRIQLAPASYSITVTDSLGCTGIASASINSSVGANATALTTNINCYGENSGVINVIVGGGSPSYTYDWADLSNSPEPEDRSNLSAGTYNLTVTALNGCTATISTTVTQPTQLTASQVWANASCGISNGYINVTIDGGVSPYNFDWSDVSGTNNSQNRTGLGAGTYTMTITDATGCTTLLSRTILQLGTPSIIDTVTNVNCYGQNSGAIQLTVMGGLTTYTYNWADINTPPEPEDRNGLVAGTYSVTVTDASSCTQTRTRTITQPAAGLSLSSSTTPAICSNSNGTITLTMTGGTSPYTFNWADISNPPEPQNRASLAAGTYSVTVTDFKGCTATLSTTVEVSGFPTITGVVTNLTCAGNFTGAIDITVINGSSPYTYNWGAGQPITQDRTGLAIGTYTVTVTTAAGCTGSLSKTVTQPALIGITPVSNNTSCGLDNGTATGTATGGTAPYTYDWFHISGSPDPNSLTALSPGTYTLTVSDSHGCTTTSTFSIATSTPTNVSGVVTNTSCGSNNGAITITATGGGPTGVTYTYDWAHISGTSNIQNLTQLASTFSYTVTVTSTLACTASATYSVGASTGVTTTGNVTNASCGFNNGSIQMTTSGATAPYTYDWSHIAGTNNPQNPTGMAAGTYNVTVTSSDGCTKLKTYTLTNSGVITLTNTITPTGCDSYSNTGSITVGVSGGLAPYTYMWNTGATTQNLANLPLGTYFLTVTDAAGCTKTSSGLIVRALAPVISGVINNPAGNNPNASITLTITSGSSPYTFDWSHLAGSNNPQNVSGLANGTYSVTVTGNNECTNTASFTIVPNFADSTGNNSLVIGSGTGLGGTIYKNDVIDLKKVMSSIDSTELVRIYPNPASTFFKIVIPSLMDQCDIRVYDALTRLILITEGADDLIVRTETWPSGLYFIYIRSKANQDGNPIWKTLLIAR